MVGLVAYHRRQSLDQTPRSNIRSTSLPVRPDLTRIPPPPGVTGTWSFSEPLSPQRVTSALSAALVTLTGTAPPTRSLDAVNKWAHTQQQRQQVRGSSWASSYVMTHSISLDMVGADVMILFMHSLLRKLLAEVVLKAGECSRTCSIVPTEHEQMSQ